MTLLRRILALFRRPAIDWEGLPYTKEKYQEPNIIEGSVD